MPLPDPEGTATDARAAAPQGADRGGRAGAGRLRLPLNALRAFEAVGERLSFTGAGAALHVSQSALSRHVGRLEDQLGCRLFERRPHGMVLTAAGAALLPVVAECFDRIGAMMEALSRDSGRGRRVLKVHMPPTFLQVAGFALLAEFRRSFPGVPIDVSSANGLGLPPGRSVDVAIVFDRPHGGDALRDPLWAVSLTPACAPDLARRADGLGLAAFLASSELVHVKLEGEPFDVHWTAYAARRGIALGASRGLAFETEALAVQCAAAGGGVALVDADLFAPDFAAGRLVAPYADASAPSGFGYYLAVHPDDRTDPGIALFRSWVVGRFAPSPAAPEDRPGQADAESKNSTTPSSRS